MVILCAKFRERREASFSGLAPRSGKKSFCGCGGESGAVMGARTVREGQSSVAVHANSIVTTKREPAKHARPSLFCSFEPPSVAQGRRRILEAPIVLEFSYIPDHLALVTW